LKPKSKISKAPAPTRKAFAKAEGIPADTPQHVLNQVYTTAKIRFVNTREKRARLELAKERDKLIAKRTVTQQASYLFVAMRQKMLNAPLTYYRKFLRIEDPHVARIRLEEMMLSMLKELHDMPRKVIDPGWLETLEED
jgi:hypothetical protein